MSTSFKPSIQIYRADGVIAKGMAVKAGSDSQHVAAATGKTDKIIGIAQNAAAAIDDQVEVALPGGGGKGLAGGTILFGDALTSDNSTGKLVATTTAGDHVIATAMDGAVVGDVFSLHVNRYNYS